MTAKDYLNRPFILNNKINDKLIKLECYKGYRQVFLPQALKRSFREQEILNLLCKISWQNQ